MKCSRWALALLTLQLLPIKELEPSVVSCNTDTWLQLAI